MVEIAFFITWIGQACFVIEVGETTVLIDPVPPKMNYGAQRVKADMVVVSHEHFDHNFIEMAEGEPRVLRGLTPEDKDWAKVDFSNADVRITTFPTHHDPNQGARRGKNAMTMIEARGLRVLHSGDLGHRLPEELVKRIGRVDVLLLCVGGFYTIDASEAREVVAQLKPRVVVPMHYKTDRTPDLPIADAEEFLKGWRHVRRLDRARVALPVDLSGYPEDEPTILVPPYKAKAADAAQPATPAP